MKSFGKSSCFLSCPGATVVVHVSKDEDSAVDYRAIKQPVNNRNTKTTEEHREKKDSVGGVSESRRYEDLIEAFSYHGNDESQNGNRLKKDGGGGDKNKGRSVENGGSKSKNMHRDSFSRGRADDSGRGEVEYSAHGTAFNNFESQYQYRQQQPDPYYGAPTAPPADEYGQGQPYYY